MPAIIRVFLLFCALCPISLSAQVFVSITGAPSFNTSVLTVTEAGNDYPGNTLESQPTTFINIANNNVLSKNNYNWSLTVFLKEQNGDLRLEIQRTGNGTKPNGSPSSGQLSGGLVPVQLLTTPVQFISGKDDRINIPVKFFIRNISVVQPAESVTFSLVFIVTET